MSGTKPAASSSGSAAAAVVVLLFLAFWAVSSCGKSSSSGGSGSLPWSDTVQGQYCSDPVNAAVAQGLADGNGESFDSVCTKLWAVDRALNTTAP